MKYKSSFTRDSITDIKKNFGDELKIEWEIYMKTNVNQVNNWPEENFEHIGLM